MNQLDFLEVPVHPRARKSDPEPSKIAAAEGERTGRFQAQSDAVLAALKERQGSTSAELAKHMKISRHIPGRRLSELERDKLVIKAGSRECRVGHRLATVWVAL